MTAQLDPSVAEQYNGTVFAFTPDLYDGVITSLVQWRFDEHGRCCSLEVYCTDDINGEFFERMTNSPSFEDTFLAAIQSGGRFVEMPDVLGEGDDYVQVDDQRPGHRRSYQLWLGERLRDGLTMMPRAVYHRYGFTMVDGRRVGAEDVAVGPILMDFAEVVALMSVPGARTYESAATDDFTEVPVVVWKMNALSRSLA